jgi:hypothetical protein
MFLKFAVYGGLVRMFLIIWDSTAFKNLGKFKFTLQALLKHIFFNNKKERTITHAEINNAFRV